MASETTRRRFAPSRWLLARWPSRATHCRSRPELVRLLGRRHVRQLLFGEQARLDAHRELDLFGRVQQRHLADLLQVVLDRVGGRAGDLRRVDRDVVVVARRDDDRAGGQRLGERGLGVLSRRPRRLGVVVRGIASRLGLAPRRRASSSSPSSISTSTLELDVVVDLDVVARSSASSAVALARGLRRRRPSSRPSWPRGLRRRASSRRSSWRRCLRGRRPSPRSRSSAACSVASVSSRGCAGWSSCLTSRFAFHRRARVHAPGRFRTLVRPLSSPGALRRSSQSRLTTGQVIYCRTLARTSDVRNASMSATTRRAGAGIPCHVRLRACRRRRSAGSRGSAPARRRARRRSADRRCG